jgi:hypothetical protein
MMTTAGRFLMRRAAKATARRDRQAIHQIAGLPAELVDTKLSAPSESSVIRVYRLVG